MSASGRSPVELGAPVSARGKGPTTETPSDLDRSTSVDVGGHGEGHQPVEPGIHQQRSQALERRAEREADQRSDFDERLGTTLAKASVHAGEAPARYPDADPYQTSLQNAGAHEGYSWDRENSPTQGARRRGEVATGEVVALEDFIGEVDPDDEAEAAGDDAGEKSAPPLPSAPVSPEGTDPKASTADPDTAGGASINGSASAAVPLALPDPGKPIGAFPISIPNERSRPESRRKVSVPSGADEDAAERPANGTVSTAKTFHLVSEKEFGHVDADFYRSLIPETKDPEGDRIHRYRLERQEEFIADVDAHGRLVSSFRDYDTRRLTRQPVKLRVRHFTSEAETKEFVYASHDIGSQNFKAADLQKMRHDRVRNLLLMGMKVPEIARQTGMDESTIRKLQKRKFPDVKRQDGRALPAEKAAQIKEMIDRGCPPAQISAETGVSKSTISRKTKRASAQKPLQTPAHLKDKAAEDVHRKAADTGDSPMPTPAGEEAFDVAPAVDERDEVLEMDDLTSRALERAGVSEEYYFEELRDEVAARAGDAVKDLVSDIEPEYMVGFLLFEWAYTRIMQATLESEIVSRLDDRSNPSAAIAGRKAGQKKSASVRKPF
jgi:hypothetical protein